MSTELFELLVQIATLLSSIALGFGAIVPIVNWLKEKMGISGRSVQVLAATVAFLFAILAGFTQGLFTPESFAPEMFIATLSMILPLSQAEYGRWLRQQEQPSKPDA